MEPFARFDELELLSEAAGMRFARVRDRESGFTAILKTCVGTPTPSFLLRLCNHHAVGRQAICGAALRPLELLRDGERYGLLLQDVDAVPLASWWAQARGRGAAVPTSTAWIRQVLSIGLQLVGALRQLHQQGILLMGVSDQSLWISTDGQLKLADFSAASRLTMDAAEQGISVDLGLLAYVSPEQTGRMNRAVDQRSDLYSLGVLLYQLLGGQTPFAAQDALDLIAHHLLSQPQPLSALNPAVSPTLEAVVHTLLEKNPEQRYQGCHGLGHDLQQCLAEIDDLSRQGLRADAARLARVRSQDVGAEFMVSERLFGREREVITLLDEFENMTRSTSERAHMVMVGGHQGSGRRP